MGSLPFAALDCRHDWLLAQVHRLFQSIGHYVGAAIDWSTLQGFAEFVAQCKHSSGELKDGAGNN
jgi:hypothetical protein